MLELLVGRVGLEPTTNGLKADFPKGGKCLIGNLKEFYARRRKERLAAWGLTRRTKDRRIVDAIPEKKLPRTTFKHGAWYHVSGGKWTRLGVTPDEVLKAYAKCEGRREPPTRDYWGSLYLRLRKNNRSRRYGWTLTAEEFAAIVARADGKCEMTGLWFDVETRGTSRRRPFAPSLDRIDSTKGYSADNCRLLCVAVNFGLSDWGDEVFWTIVEAAAKAQAARSSAERRA